ncbi:collagen type III alpha [Actinoplanes lutulentus]|uniref:HIRAN domain-containing protein n=1 Tax=Actinoplanes lutulentus TaxID=1287878 RepID=A0A327ZLK8_9ACTN|nr:HIRAN domain-containing protein [Actinoplanes lutulentus]MBB2941051.1 collagen type III alpha [Actinoplanes lutulentus]RAK43360.1 HIRAN domain-containing protein [Actinoplanes lutulentus]
MSVGFDLWGQRGWAEVEVVGESHYATALKATFGRPPDGGDEIETVVRLTPEPRNPHDRNAVSVWAGAGQIGYLSRADAARYAPVLSELAGQGWDPRVTAHIWGGDWGHSARLELAAPHLLVPANGAPAGPHLMLPLGGAIQVTGEEKHLDALIPWLCAEGECWVHATLHEVSEQLARSVRTVAEVRVDGARVGQLTPKMSGEVLPAVRLLAEGGLVAGVRAIVKGNRIKAEVVLHVARAHELPESWITDAHVYAVKLATGAPVVEIPVSPPVVPAEPAFVAPAAAWDPVVIPPEPSGVRFVVPPSWPAPPAGWKPPPGWRPDPAWPAPPYGWQWWIPSWD